MGTDHPAQAHIFSPSNIPAFSQARPCRAGRTLIFGGWLLFT